ncbi:MAG: hypothetical protein F6K65_26945, partial [Moorea sp. SIO3C2]|nr:hypothetical protein [Moorena sp. SIO3C2]
YKAFFEYLKSPDYQYCFPLKPGQCLLINNFRVLHGRTGYNTNYGSRHLEVGYLDWDYLKGRQKFRQFKHLYLQK